MLHRTRGSRFHSFVFSIVRMVSALVTFLTLGFVYTSLEMWFSDKDMDFEELGVSMVHSCRCFIHSKKSFDFQMAALALSFIGSLSLLGFVAVAPAQLKVPLYDSDANTVTWISADAFTLPTEDTDTDEAKVPVPEVSGHIRNRVH